MSMAEREDVGAAAEFFNRYYSDGVAELARLYPKDRESLTVDYADVAQFDDTLADRLKKNPEEVRASFQQGLVEALTDLPVGGDYDDVQVRFENVYDATRSLTELRKEDVDKLRSVTAQIGKASAVRPVLQVAAYECERCGTLEYLPIDRELIEPQECKACERPGPFLLKKQQSTFKNHQAIRLKQPPDEATNTSQVGSEFTAHILGDVAGDIPTGQRAEVTGILRVEFENDDPTAKYYFEAQSVRSLSEDYNDLEIETHRETIEQKATERPFRSMANSVAPGITGGDEIEIETPWGETYNKYWWMRLAVSVANLFGSWRRSNGDGTFERGSSHTLFIGDPSTGKSTIMSAVERISPRSSSESGKNVTGAGLTAAAVRDDFGDSEWSLEPGALPKAHGGVAAVDEIDKMGKDGLSRLHSALEKEQLEVSKAGIEATLQCETSLLAAGNPSDSRFSKFSEDVSEIDIVSSLLDRFDLIFTLKDTPDRDKDAQIAETTLTQRAESGLVDHGELSRDEQTAANAPLTVEELRSWVAIARQEVYPVIQDESVRQRLKDFYVEKRQENEDEDDDGESAIPVTVRTLDALQRLAEASARLRLSETVEMIDAEMAIALKKVSLQDVGYDEATGQMDVDVANGRGSWSQKERRNRLKGIIETLESDSGTVDRENVTVDRENVIESAVAAGIDEQNAEDAIEKMVTKGELYCPNGRGNGLKKA